MTVFTLKHAAVMVAGAETRDRRGGTGVSFIRHSSGPTACDCEAEGRTKQQQTGRSHMENNIMRFSKTRSRHGRKS